MRIGSTELKLGICLAPMAGYSDRAMRAVCHGLGAEYSVTEMVSAKAVVHGDKKTHALARIFADEGPVALQIFGSEPEVMAEAASILSCPAEGVPPVAIDINMGCPVRKIFRNGEGSALMRDPSLIEKIVRKTADATPLPVTVKLRIGVDSEHINVTECAKAAEAAGASAICVHGRTTAEMYSGRSNPAPIAEVRRAVNIPVIANGDVACGEDAINLLCLTGADAIAVGRAAVGNPFVFKEIEAALAGREYTPPTADERAEIALLQLRMAIEDKGERVAVTESRGQIALYLKSFRGAAALRAEINRALTYKEVESVMIRAVLGAKNII